ncbi:hypothetical protein FOA52_001449 [Chlamydomonas sp. UWO 241]|nr:hypothetical protein FOA52_001449 [Chlamydomonas sp. UWO 241]
MSSKQLARAPPRADGDAGGDVGGGNGDGARGAGPSHAPPPPPSSAAANGEGAAAARAAEGGGAAAASAAGGGGAAAARAAEGADAGAASAAGGGGAAALQSHASPIHGSRLRLDTYPDAALDAQQQEVCIAAAVRLGADAATVRRQLLALAGNKHASKRALFKALCHVGRSGITIAQLTEAVVSRGFARWEVSKSRVCSTHQLVKTEPLASAISYFQRSA